MVARSNPPTVTEMARIADPYTSTTLRELTEHPRKWTPYRQEQTGESYNTFGGKSDKTWHNDYKSATKREVVPKREPPNLPNFDVNSGPRCYNCGEFRHISAKCPQKNCLILEQTSKYLDLTLIGGKINGHKVDRMILDSGCTMTLVHPRHLPNNYK